MKNEKLRIKIQKISGRSWPVIFIILIWFIFSWPFFSKGLVPFPSNYLVTYFPPWQYFFEVSAKNTAMPDVLSQLYPWRHLVVESFKNGQFPLWNPYLFSGTPLLANFQSAAFSPLNILFFLLPFAKAWSLLILFQPILAGLFTFLFLRELKISRYGSLMGALAFSFSGFMVTWMAYGTLSLAVVWLPLLLWAIEKNFKNISALALTLISLSLAFSFFSGHFQTTLYVLLVGIIFSFFKFWQTRNLKPFLLTTGFFLLGLLFILPQIIPSIELYFQSVRGASFKQTEVIPPSYLITLLAPDFFGNPTTGNNWFGHYAEWAGFIGLWPLILGLFAILKNRKRKEVVFFFFLGMSTLFLALQTPLADLLIKLKIPVLSTSSSSRIIVIFSFSFAVLAGFGIDGLRGIWEKKENLKKTVLFLLLIGFIFAALWLIIMFSNFIPDDKVIVAQRNFVLPSLIFGAGLIIWLAGFWVKKSLRPLFLICLLLLIAFDVLRFAKKWMPFEKEEHLYPDLAITKFLQKEVGDDRVFGNFGNELAVYFHLPAIEGYDPLYPKRYKELVSAATNGQIGDLFDDRSTVLLDKNGKYSERLISLLGVKYLLYAKDDGWSPWVFPFWKNLKVYELIYDGPKYQVLQNRNTLPRAFLISDYEVIEDSASIINKLLDERFDLRKKVILEEGLGEQISSGSGEVKIIKYEPNRIEIELEQDTPQLLFLSDNYYPGWQAKVDGNKTKIYRANYTFRSIFVPAGNHLVEFIYDPPLFRIALFISGGVITFLLLLNTWTIIKRKQ